MDRKQFKGKDPFSDEFQEELEKQQAAREAEQQAQVVSRTPAVPNGAVDPIANPRRAKKTSPGPKKQEPADDGGQVPWRKPASQAEHMKAIRSSHSLKGNARLVAFDAHLQIGLESVSNGTEFPDTKKELTAAYLAMFTGLSENKARDWMKEACRLGFFRRVDNGKGGRNNSNRATYLPTVPQWFS